jgi:glycerol-3-phosphate cytidylyltransferase-like family protein
VGEAEARRIAGQATVVRGYFDPLLAWHAERLEQVKRGGMRLLVVIASPGNPILPGRARAELVAGLRVVDYVTEANIETIDMGPQICLEQEDAACFKRLAIHVNRRAAAL